MKSLAEQGALHHCRHRHQHLKTPLEKVLSVDTARQAAGPTGHHSPRRSPPVPKSSGVTPGFGWLLISRRHGGCGPGPAGPTRNRGWPAEPHLRLQCSRLDALFIGGDLTIPSHHTIFFGCDGVSASLWGMPY